MVNLDEYENLSWHAYHVSSNLDDEARDFTMLLNYLLPLFYEDAKSIAMIRHGMDIVKIAVDILNPGQISIITAINFCTHFASKFSGAGQTSTVKSIS